MNTLYHPKYWIIFPWVWLWIFSTAVQAQQLISLEQAVALAQQHDPWLQSNRARQQALEYSGEASSALPDPMLSMAVANLPTDGFAFNQEPMTQLKVGVSQRLPRGDSLDIKRQYFLQLAQQHPLQRLDRRAQTRLTVARLWLELHLLENSIKLIETDRSQFEQMIDIVEARYANGLTDIGQQDVVTAQLELTRLDDRLLALTSRQEQIQMLLLGWLGEETVNWSNEKFIQTQAHGELSDREYSRWQAQIQLLVNLDHNQKASLLAQHPAVQAIQKEVEASKTDTQLARQRYKPQWALNASYGYRQDNQFGQSRADFLSVGVSVDLPLFSSSSTDNKVKASISTSQALITDQRLLLREYVAQFGRLLAQSTRLIQRHKLYTNNIIPQLHGQSESALTAYTNDDGDFAEVVRSRIDELTTHLQYLRIQVDLAKTKQELDYYLTSSSLQSVYSKDH